MAVPATKSDSLPRAAFLAILLTGIAATTGSARAEGDKRTPDTQAGEVHGEDLRGRDLSYQDLAGADLRGASFAGAEIDAIELKGADLRNTKGWSEAKNFYAVHADDAIFDGADLSNAVTGGYFERASFRGANLSNATLDGRFHGASFDGAIVEGALFLGADGTQPLHEELRARGAIVDGEGFAAAVAAGRAFRGATLSGVDVSGVDLASVVLTEANLNSARLNGSDLSDANLRGTILAWAEAKRTAFDRATLSQGVCGGLDAKGASFRGAALVGTDFCSADLKGADFTDADLSNADLRGADLTGADLTGAKLDGVQIDDAVLDDVKGLNDEELAALRTRAARWRHDLGRSVDDFLRQGSLSLHLALSGLALAAAVYGGATGRMKGAFALLAVVNGAAFVPFALFVLFSIAGGSPVAQMSGYEMWSMWLHGWPLLLVWVGSAGIIGIGLALWEMIERSVLGPRGYLPLSIAMAVATPLNCFFAFQVLFLIAPDA